MANEFPVGILTIPNYQPLAPSTRTIVSELARIVAPIDSYAEYSMQDRFLKLNFRLIQLEILSTFADHDFNAEGSAIHDASISLLTQGLFAFHAIVAAGNASNNTDFFSLDKRLQGIAISNFVRLTALAVVENIGAMANITRYTGLERLTTNELKAVVTARARIAIYLGVGYLLGTVMTLTLNGLQLHDAYTAQDDAKIKSKQLAIAAASAAFAMHSSNLLFAIKTVQSWSTELGQAFQLAAVFFGVTNGLLSLASLSVYLESPKLGSTERKWLIAEIAYTATTSTILMIADVVLITGILDSIAMASNIALGVIGAVGTLAVITPLQIFALSRQIDYSNQLFKLSITTSKYGYTGDSMLASLYTTKTALEATVMAASVVIGLISTTLFVVGGPAAIIGVTLGIISGVLKLFMQAILDSMATDERLSIQAQGGGLVFSDKALKAQYLDMLSLKSTKKTLSDLQNQLNVASVVAVTTIQIESSAMELLSIAQLASKMRTAQVFVNRFDHGLVVPDSSISVNSSKGIIDLGPGKLGTTQALTLLTPLLAPGSEVRQRTVLDPSPRNGQGKNAVTTLNIVFPNNSNDAVWKIFDGASSTIMDLRGTVAQIQTSDKKIHDVSVDVHAGDGDDTIILGVNQATVDGGAGNNMVRYDGLDAQSSIIVKPTATGFIVTKKIVNSNIYVEKTSSAAILYGKKVETVAYRDLSLQKNANTLYRTDVLTNVQVLGGGKGNDFMQASDTGNTLLGNDGDDILLGGVGNDLLVGGLGSDQESGGKGDDTFGQSVYDTTCDWIDGGDGNNAVDYSLPDDNVDASAPAVVASVASAPMLAGSIATRGVKVDLSIGIAHKQHLTAVDVLKNIQNVAGSDLDDQLTGDTNDNMLAGKDGNDVLVGAAGDDVLDGGADTDALYGAEGNDVLYGGAGADKIWGGAGNDRIMQDMGKDNDLLDGGDGQDTVDYSLTDLSALSATVGVVLNLATGIALKLAAGNGVDTLANIENVIGTVLNDVLTGDAHDNIMQGGVGADTVNGGGGNDLIVEDMDGSNDQIDGGDGSDTVDYSFTDISNLGKTAGVIVNLVTDVGQKLASGGVDTLKNIENVFGTGLADVLTGDDGNNVLRGEAGSDTINGGGGNDLIVQDLQWGNDKINGGDGVDTVDYSITDVSTLGQPIGVIANLATGVAQRKAVTGVDTLKNIENVVGSCLADVLTGDTGNNGLSGADGNDQLDGGDGDDVLLGGAGADIVNGGAGNDVIGQDMVAGNDLLDGGAGNDMVDYSLTDLSGLGKTLGVTVNLVTGVAQKLAAGGAVDTLKNIENVMGTALADVITGDAGNNLLFGLGGADIVNGGGGNDVIEQDIQCVSDRLDGGDGVDTLDYSFSDLSALNVLRGVNVNLTSGLTYKWATNGVDTLKNFENVIGTALADALTGDAGNNTLWGGVGDDALFGAAGDDVLMGGIGNDQLYGQDGDDILFGGAGVDLINGGAGNDVIEQDIEANNDQLNGGDGVDMLDYSLTDLSTLNVTVGVNVNLATGIALKLAAGIGIADTFYGIENATGTKLADVLTGNAGNNVLRGGAGADVINGAAGNDLIVQDMDGSGDQLDGGSGNDTVDYSFNDLSALSAPLGVRVNLATGLAQKLATGSGVDTLKNIENVTGTDLADMLTGDGGNNILQGGAGSDIVNGGGGSDVIVQDVDGSNDQLDGGDGQDTVDYSLTDLSALSASLGVSVNLATGVAQKRAIGNGMDTLKNIENVFGTALADVITGDGGDNLLRGEAGSDTINGGGGNDLIAQDMDDSSDQLDGGDGLDTVDYSVTDLSTLNVTAGVRVNLVTGVAQKLATGNGVDTLKNIENLVGTALADVMIGDAGNNLIRGGAGADIVNGGAGNDYLLQDMDGSNDQLDGSDGQDTVDYSVTDLSKLGKTSGVTVNLVTGVGQKQASGGVDTLKNIENVIGTALADVLTGDSSNNILQGGAGSDSVNGGAGNDLIVQDMDGVNDQLDGGADNDTVDYSVTDLSKSGKTSGVAVNLVTGVAQKLASGGVDTLKNIENVTGTGLADVLTGDGGNNILQGGRGADTVNGGAGNDYLIQDIDGANDLLDGGDGNDTVDYSLTDLSKWGQSLGLVLNLATGVAQKRAGGGVDTLKNIENVIGTALADVLTGDGGNNILQGGGGADTINGGAGSDYLIQDMDGANDELDGGDGLDTVDYSVTDLSKLGQNLGVNVNLVTGVAQKRASGGVDTLKNIENVIGTALADVLTGDGGNNLLQGGAGSDSINGGAGNDLIVQDMLADSDQLDGGDGLDTVDYSKTDLSTLGKTSGVTVNLVTGVAQKLASGGVDTLKNIENVVGTTLADVIAGDGGNNVIQGGAGSDILTGGAGNDYFIQDMDGANDQLDGGADNDTVDYSFTDLSKLGKTSGVTVNLVTGVAQKLASGGVDTLKNIENVTGTALADMLTGDGGNNVMQGGAGSDIVNGGAGNDYLIQNMDGSNDQLDGGSDNDTVDYSFTDLSKLGKTVGVEVNLVTGVAQKWASGGVDTLKNIENVIGTALADVMTGNGANNVIQGGAGADTINGGAGDDYLIQDMDGVNDQLDGGADNDTVDYSFTDLSKLGQTSGVTVNLATGVAQKLASGGVDTLKNIENVVGTALADVLTGDGGNNLLQGGAGADTINGGAGDDYVLQDMEKSNDLLDGGDGLDTVDYSITDLTKLGQTSGVQVNLAMGVAKKLASGGVDTLKNIENVVGTALADVLTGDGGNNLLQGGAGSDIINGGGGDDWIMQDMDGANDQLDGSDGLDTVDYSATDLSQSGQTAGVIVNLLTGVGQKLAAGGATDRLNNIENVIGTALADVLTGDGGNNLLRGEAGTDIVNGGDGDDVIAQDMMTGNDSLNGGNGNDTVDYGVTDLSQSGQTVGVIVDLVTGVGQKLAAGSAVDTLNNIESVIGTARADQLTGDGGNNGLAGGGGNDILNGGDGNDVLQGGAGCDIVNGGAGNDVIVQDLERVNDQLDGGAGNDTLDYSFSDLSGLNTLLGVNVNLATGITYKSATNGMDTIKNIENVIGTSLIDQLRGDAGSNMLWGGDGDDLLFGDAGDDVLMGGVGSDQLYGQDGNDILFGGAGADTINGGDGDDVIEQDITADSDQLNGGNGNDTLDYSVSDLSAWSGTVGVNINLATGVTLKLAVGSGVSDSFYNIENATGTARADVIIGNLGANQLMGGAGDDTLDGAAGNDTLLGGAGADNIQGGSGDDVIGQDMATDNDRIDGGTGQDTVDYSVTDLSTLGANVTLGVNVDLNSGMAQKLAAGSGVDTLLNIENVTGTALADVITGNADNNILFGGGGADVVNGGGGNDVIEQDLQAVNDRLDGGDGVDTVDYSVTDLSALQVVRGVNVNLTSGIAYKWATNGVDTLSNIESVIGTALADQLTGDAGNNGLWGGDGDDLLDGAAGDDALMGGGGNDQLYGQDGNDILFGGAGTDVVKGGAGNDLIEQDMVAGNDQLDGNDGVDTLDYSVTDLSALSVTLGVNVNLNSGVALKLAAGAGAVDTFINIENVVGTALADVLTGNADNNVLQGGIGSDLVTGGGGNDVIVQDIDGGNDQLDGGDGLDTVDYSFTNLSQLGQSVGVNVNLATGVAQKNSAGKGVDTLANIENVIGTALADVITGDAGNNLIQGGAGADTINGGGGNDWIVQDMLANNDQLDGGDGQDTVDYSITDLSQLGKTSGVAVNLATGIAQKLASGGVDALKNIENVIGTTLADVITGDAGNNTLQGGMGSDRISGGAGNDYLIQDIDGCSDTLDGGDGVDTVDYSVTDLSNLLVSATSAPSGVNVNLVTGVAQKLAVGKAADTLKNIENVIGTALADVITGSVANNTLQGGAGSDSVSGGAGNDYLIQDMDGSSDTLDGGDGVDTVDYSVTDLSKLGNTAGVMVNLVTGVAQKLASGGVDTLMNIENVIGTALADVITGDGGNNVIQGGAGSDILNGGAGNDYFLQSMVANNDQLDGGDGLDTVDYSSTDLTKLGQSAGVTVNLVTGVAQKLASGGTDTLNNIENVTGTALADVITGDGGSNILQGGAGSDSINGGAGNDLIVQDMDGSNDQLDGGSGQDTVDYSFTDLSTLGQTVGVIVNLVAGVAQKKASGGTDTLNNIENVTGTALADILTGDGGNNILQSGAGSDIVNGGGGDDWIAQTMSVGNDQLDGGDGNDTADYSLSDLSALSVSAGVNANLSTGLVQKLAAGGGVDTLSNIENLIGTAQSDVITGNAGDNQLLGGAGNDVLDGAGGNDILSGGAGSDSVQGGAGDDLIEQDLQGVKDQIDGGDGLDTVDYSVTDVSALNVALGVNVNLATGTAYKAASGGTDTLLNIENVVGTALADQIYGDGGNNGIWGGDGADLLNGFAGDDVLMGGAGNDQLYGSDGNDTLFGGAGADVVRGGSGDDVIGQDLEAVNDRIDGGDGTDTVDYSVTDLSVLTVTVGVNANLSTGLVQKLAVGGGVDTLANIENVTGTALADVLTGNIGDNQLMGGAGNDVLDGGAGNDTLFGGAGVDSIQGGAGNDVIEQDLQSVNDRIDGGDGVDTVDYSISDLSTLSATLGVNVNLATGSAYKLVTGAASGGTDTLLNIENVVGTALADQIDGDGGNNGIWGGDGADLLNGFGGDDVLIAGAGNDQVYGADGNDTLFGGTGADDIRGGSGDDLIEQDMEAVNDQIDGNDGVDTVDYRLSDLSALAVSVGVNVDLSTGVAQKLATGGVDTLANIENVTGTALADVLTGNAGNNVLIGGGGNDTLTGGGGADTYWFGRGDGQDRIIEAGYVAGDNANLNTIAWAADVASNQLWFARSGNDLQVNIVGTTDQISMSNWYVDVSYRGAQFKAGDGKTLNYTQVDALVQAMAAYLPPALGQTALSANLQATVAPVLIACWH